MVAVVHKSVFSQVCLQLMSSRKKQHESVQAPTCDQLPTLRKIKIRMESIMKAEITEL